MLFTPGTINGIQRQPRFPSHDWPQSGLTCVQKPPLHLFRLRPPPHHHPPPKSLETHLSTHFHDAHPVDLMPPREGLPGIDGSLRFSRLPLHHLFLVIPGAGDPYVDHPPWMTSLESSLSILSKNYTTLAHHPRRRHLPCPSVLFLPVEWHRAAFETWQSQVRHADPRPSHPNAPTTVREAVAETIGDVLLMASGFWRHAIAKHIGAQIREQVSAVRRNRPRFSGRVSLLVHSVGALVATELLRGDVLGDLQLDSVVFAGCPLPMYAALAPDGGEARMLAIVREKRAEVRFINVYHPLDPVAYRLEPFVGEEGSNRAAVRVRPKRRGFWDDAGFFWEEVVWNLWGTLFPERERERASGGVGELFKVFGRGKTKEEDVQDDGGEDRGRVVGYEVGEEEEEEEGGGAAAVGGSEVLLSDRIDYELQDGMGVPPLDVMASWGAIKAHTYYWQSVDVAQILLDIAVTSDDSMAAR